MSEIPNYFGELRIISNFAANFNKEVRQKGKRHITSTRWWQFLLFSLFTIHCSLFTVSAQESQTTYNFLRLPVSAHVSALGGENITLPDDDATLIFHNPSLINFVSDKTINLNYMTYMEGAKTASAAFVKAAGERASWGVMAQYMDYGKMRQTTSENIQIGEFGAKDICIGASFAYALTEFISGGITAKVISSNIADYHSLAVGVDLGLNYTDDIGDLSISLAAKNLGGQVKAYDNEFEKIPFDLQAGITKRFANSPLRFSLTMSRLHDWDQALLRHIALGADIMLSDNIYIAAGYNFRRAHEMKISDNEGSSRHGAGLSLGAGISLQRFKLHVAYAKYHVSASSLIFNVSYSL